MVNKQKKSQNKLTSTIKVNAKGAGKIFLEDDRIIYIPKENIGTALNDDIVEIHITSKSTDRIQGEVTKIIERSKKNYVGTLDKNPGGRSFIIPDDRRFYMDVFIPNSEVSNIKNKQKVVFEITKWESIRKSPRGKITKVIGKSGTHKTELEAILAEKGFDPDFGNKTLEESRKIEKNFLNDINKEATIRKDMRKIPTFTIDPRTAQDFDDAISVRIIDKNIYEIGIHIADVSHYVKPNTAIDREAKERATSVYMVDRTVPMLPEILSNNICSLKPKVDRLAFSTIAIVTSEGEVKKKWFGKTIIRSNKRFGYMGAQELLEDKSGNLYSELKILRDIARKLKRKRVEHGSILFDKEEVIVELDKKGKPTNISIKPRVETQSIIEEWMLLANRCVAEKVSESVKNKKIAGFAYRIHERPDRSHVIDLANFIKGLGYHLKHNSGKIQGADLNQLFETVSGTNVEDVVKQAALRTMSKAVYTTKNVGHFGLAFGNYTHFTSPIRRYPDILVHRLLEKELKGNKITKKEIDEYQKILEHSSKKEREAERAERDSIKFKQAEFMADKIGRTFSGIITGVTEWGLYVEESKTKTHGLVKISSLGNDFFELDEKNYQLIGTRTKKRFRLGDKVKVKLTRVDIESRNIDFELI